MVDESLNSLNKYVLEVIKVEQNNFFAFSSDYRIKGILEEYTNNMEPSEERWDFLYNLAIKENNTYALGCLVLDWVSINKMKELTEALIKKSKEFNTMPANGKRREQPEELRELTKIFSKISNYIVDNYKICEKDNDFINFKKDLEDMTCKISKALEENAQWNILYPPTVVVKAMVKSDDDCRLKEFLSTFKRDFGQHELIKILCAKPNVLTGYLKEADYYICYDEETLSNLAMTGDKELQKIVLGKLKENPRYSTEVKKDMATCYNLDKEVAKILVKSKSYEVAKKLLENKSFQKNVEACEDLFKKANNGYYYEGNTELRTKSYQFVGKKLKALHSI